MRYNVLEQGFPATLKTPEGEILEYGRAFISPDQQGITFKNDFVPLFKMGTPLGSVRTRGDIETQRFSGTVYLSAQNLLQIVAVTDEVLPGAASAFLYDTCLAAEVTAKLLPKAPQGFWAKLFHRPKEEVRTVPVTITAISLSELRLYGDIELSQDQRFTVTIPQLQIDQMLVQVDLALEFGQEDQAGIQKNYRCRILEPNGPSRLLLEPFVETLSQRANKLFPPVN